MINYPKEMSMKVGNTVVKKVVNNLQEELSFIKMMKQHDGSIGA